MSIKTNALRGLSLISGLFSTASVFAECDAQILQIEAQGSASSAYDVFNGSPYGLEKSFNAKIKTDCPVTLIVSSIDNSLSLSGKDAQKLHFSYHAPRAEIQNKQLVFASTAEDTYFPFALRFAAKQYAPAGTMYKQMQAQLWHSRSNQLLAEKKFSLIVKVNSSAAVYFSGINQRSMHVDLGELSTGKRINNLPQLRVISTSPYALSFSSENLGKLKHSTNKTDSINYSFSVNNQELNLSSGEQKWFSSDMTSYLGQLIGLSMSIASTEQKPAGFYQDTLYISVKPSLVIY